MLDSNCLGTIDFFDTKEEFDKHGFAGPFSLADDTCLEALRFDEPAPELCSGGIKGWHASSQSFQRVIADKNFQDKVTSLCGRDLVIWRSGFFHKNKMPTSADVGWHHDKHFQGNTAQPLDFDEIGMHISILFALRDMGRDNGRLEVIPFSHVNIEGYDRDCRTYAEKQDSDHFITDLPQALQDSRRSVLLDRGSFFLFHSGLLHRSQPFRSGRKRSSFALRLVPSFVSVPDSLSPFYLAIS